MAECNLTPIPSKGLERTLGMPPEGPKCIPIPLDFSAFETYKLDYSNMAQRGFISMVQTVYVDNYAGTDILDIFVPATNQHVKVPAGVQGYFTVLCPNPIKLEFSCADAANTTAQVILMNFPTAAAS